MFYNDDVVFAEQLLCENSILFCESVCYWDMAKPEIGCFQDKKKKICVFQKKTLQ